MLDLVRLAGLKSPCTSEQQCQTHIYLLLWALERTPCNLILTNKLIDTDYSCLVFSFYLLDEATVAKRDVDRLESLFLRRQIHSTPMWVQDFV